MIPVFAPMTTKTLKHLHCKNFPELMFSQAYKQCIFQNVPFL